MKIERIRTVELELPASETDAEPRREHWTESGPIANPMTRYERYADHRSSWRKRWEKYLCVVEATDGTTGFAVGFMGKPAAQLIETYLGPRLEGEPCMATDKVYDMAVRLCSPVSSTGMASYAISAIDLALWDLKGKLLERPVYELIGGPAHDELECYATGNDTDWHLELGFEATKLACPYGPADGREGLKNNVDLVAERRELIGDDRELMLDCWMAFTVDYAVRLAERLRPYDLRWIEECLPPEDLSTHETLRERLPWISLATGEHWYSTSKFQRAASRGLVDVVQPDINWVGGMTAMCKIASIAEAAGIDLIPHAAGNSPYGQHACYGLSAIQWCEFFVTTPPGVPPEEGPQMPGLEAPLPGVPVPNDGALTPSSEPGFGIDLDPTEFSPYL